MKAFFKEFKLIHWASPKDLKKYLKLCLFGMIILGIYISCIDMGVQTLISKIISIF